VKFELLIIFKTLLLQILTKFIKLWGTPKIVSKRKTRND